MPVPLPRPLPPTAARAAARLVAAAVLVAAALLAAPEAAAQPLAFGAADDPLELGSSPSSPDRVVLEAYGGPAFLRAGWRTALHGEATVLRGRFSASVGGALHPGSGGLYPREADDPYDALRAVRYVRVQPREGGRGPYARVGPLTGVTLGTGMLARRYRTDPAWDERRIGAEAAVRGRGVRAGAFIGDVLGGGVLGAEVEVGTGLGVGRARGLRLGLAAVHDLSLPASGETPSGETALTGVEAVVRGDLFAQDGLRVSPYVSAAQLLGKGGGVGVGLAVEADDLGAVARGHARLGLVASRGRFAPGFVGPFYAVAAGRQRIVAANSAFDDDPGVVLAGTPLDSLRGGLDLTADLRAVAFGRVEAMLYARRHYGPGARSAFSLRLAARAGETRFELGLEKEGFRSLFSLFGGSLGELNTLVLDVAVPVEALGAHAFVRSRYGYRRIPGAETEGGPRLFLVERRFEPMLGLRARF